MCRMRRSLTTTTRHALTLCKAQLCSKALHGEQQQHPTQVQVDVKGRKSYRSIQGTARHQKLCPGWLLLHHTEHSILVGDVLSCATEGDTSSPNSSQCSVGTGRARSAASRAVCRTGGHGGLAGQMCAPLSSCRILLWWGSANCSWCAF